MSTVQIIACIIIILLEVTAVVIFFSQIAFEDGKYKGQKEEWNEQRKEFREGEHND